MMLMQILFVAAVCFISIPSFTTSSLTAYDCSSYTPPLHVVDIAYVLPQCETIDRLITVGATIFEPIANITVIGYRCKIKFTQTLVDVSGSSRVVSNGTETIDRRTCLKAHEDKAITLAGSLIPFLDTNGTVSHTVRVDDQNLAEDNITGNHTRQHHYTRMYEITLSTTKGIVDLQQDIVRLDDDVFCDSDGSSCQDDEFGQIFWKPPAINEYSLIFQGAIVLLQANFPISPEIHYVVVSHHTDDHVYVLRVIEVKIKVTSDEHRIFRATDIPNLYIMLSNEVGYIGSFLGLRANELFKNIYSEPRYEPVFQIVDVVKRCCEHEKRHYYNHLKSLPTMSNITFLQNGWVGTKGRGILFLKECKQEQVFVRKTDQCFREIPVKDKQNNEKFLDSTNRILYNQGNACESQSKNSNFISSKELQTATEPPLTSLGNSSTKSLPYPAIKTPSQGHPESQKMKNSQELDCTDWVKIIAIGMVCVWAFVILVRIIKLGLHYLCKNKDQQNENVNEDPSIFSVGSFMDALKPPFMGNSFKWKRHHDEKEPELNVSYAA